MKEKISEKAQKGMQDVSGQVEGQEDPEDAVPQPAYSTVQDVIKGTLWSLWWNLGVNRSIADVNALLPEFGGSPRTMLFTSSKGQKHRISFTARRSTHFYNDTN